MELNVTITKKQFNNYITKLRNSKKSSCYELKKWEDFNEQYFELIKKYIKDNVTDSDEKIRIYFMPFYDSKYYAFRVKYESQCEECVESKFIYDQEQEFFKKMTWFEDKKYSLWVFEDDFAYFYLEAIRKIEGMSIFSRWLSYLRIRNKHVKNFNLSGFDDEYTCESMFLYLIKDLITELNGENNKNNAETKLFRNLKVDHNNSSNYKFEIVSNELFRKLADDKFNEFCTKFNELKIEKPLEDYQFYYSNKDQIISKLLEFYIYVYKSLFSTLLNFINLSYSQDDIEIKCINLKNYCFEYFNAQFVPEFIFNNPYFNYFTTLYDNSVKMLSFINKNTKISDRETKEFVKSFKFETYYFFGLIVSFLTYINFLRTCSIEKATKI